MQASVSTRTASHEVKSLESTKILRTTSSSGRSKDSATEGAAFGSLAQLRTKSKGDPNVDSKALATAVAAAAAAAASATVAESRRLLKKGPFIAISRTILSWNSWKVTPIQLYASPCQKDSIECLISCVVISFIYLTTPMRSIWSIWREDICSVL